MTNRQLRGRLQRSSFPVGDFERTLFLHLPAAASPMPLVMMLHGAGGSAEFAFEETGWSRLAEEEGFAVCYPEGLPISPEKKPKFLTNPQEWNDGSERGQHEDVRFLSELFDRLPDAIDRSRVYVTGFSNGAGMTFRLASELSDRIAAIAPVAGHCWIDPKPARPVPTLYIVGDADPLVPLNGGTVRTYWNTNEYRPKVAETVDKWGQAISREADGEFFKHIVVPNHGHHWPGGRGLLGEQLGGPISKDLDATREIWRFFRNRNR